jgi:hypothetical protein
MRWVLGMLLACAAVAAQAADEEGRFAADGVGNRTCQQFLDAIEDDERLTVAFASWTEGFMTATNALNDDTFDLTPWQTVEVIMLKMQVFCRNNPDTVYMLGLGQLISTLVPDRLTDSDEIVRVEADGRATFIYRGVLEAVRGKLEERGLTVPKEPGVFDELFVAALRELQGELGIPESGLPDQRTMIALFER